MQAKDKNNSDDLVSILSQKIKRERFKRLIGIALFGIISSILLVSMGSLLPDLFHFKVPPEWNGCLVILQMFLFGFLMMVENRLTSLERNIFLSNTEFLKGNVEGRIVSVEAKISDYFQSDNEKIIKENQELLAELKLIRDGENEKILTELERLRSHNTELQKQLSKQSSIGINPENVEIPDTEDTIQVV